MDELHRSLTALVDGGKVPGLVAAVAGADGPVRVEVLGAAAFGAGAAPMRRDTPFRLTSVTKPMVAAVAMMLVEDGLLALDEPVDRLLPELAGPRVLRRLDAEVDDTVPAHRAITVEDVLTYRMGHGVLLDPAADPPFNPPYPVVRAAEALRLTLARPDPRTPHGVDEWMRRFGTLPLLFQPGERWAYNSSGHVLGVLVARAAGAPLGEVMRQRLFDPLGMTSTGFSTTPRRAAQLPAQYLGGERQTDVATAEDWSREPAFPDGAAGLVSTVDDVVAFGRFMLHGGQSLLPVRAVRAMTTDRLTPAQVEGGGMLLGGHGWGYGMTVQADGTYGWDGGYGTSWRNSPSQGTVRVLLTQVSDVLFDGTVQEFNRVAVHR
ncbi:beta-lactamase family protein [Dactylosporangium aurantiacum]|uniref:Beta-lactamase family protein n=1 Tax=Dactylosporangium aurantiacum TaxID=35754 RepID=A0A9Q9I993_9ACTN|nr:serine hydrolase domain-containing protein [Dactylosporangium aurantiacum]MDG6104991.1 serine hydrolase [Dactylosporangium aurantiacum]UWZ51526.1 beta-lactamase family protein [Dactylosporangium aurantiacum]